MLFEKTETFYNLARSFAGECQAGMRYQLIAKTAMTEGFKTLSDEIKKIAKNETNHARRFFESLLKYGGSKDDVHLDASYPFHAGTLVEGLKFAAMDEQAESKEIYPTFGKIAKEEGYEDIAALYSLVAKVEESHKVIFSYLAQAVKDGTLYKADKAMLWVCSECGHMHSSKEAWKVCPLCQKEQGYVELHLPFEGVKI